MKCYKLTSLDQTTQYGTKFEVGIPVYAKGTSSNLCSDGWIHFYVNPIIAVLMNPAHADFDPFLMWECETGGEEKHEKLKSGCKILTIVRQIEPPAITLENKIAFGILCAMEVRDDGSRWIQWAKKWLSGEDRTLQSANNAFADAYGCICVCLDVHAASANAYASVAASAAAAYAAAHADTYAAARCASHAAATTKHINFVALAEKALTIS